MSEGFRQGLVSLPADPVPSRELILRARFREDAEGRLNLYEKHESGSSRAQFGGKSLSEVLHGRFDKVLVEQLGTHGIVSVGVDEPLDLLRLKLPPDMEAAIVGELSPDQPALARNPEIYRFSFGPEAKPSTPPDGGN